MSDRPDYTLPVSIEAITIESLPVDILAQTVGSIAIDIAAQTLGQVDVNIKASAITLNVDITAQTLEALNINITSAITLNVDITAQTIGNLSVNISAGQPEAFQPKIILNADFEAAGHGWRVTGPVTIPGESPKTGTGSCQFNSGAYTEIVQGPLTPPVPVNDIDTFTVNVNIGGADDGVWFEVDYTDGTSDSDWWGETTGYENKDLKSCLTAGKTIQFIWFGADESNAFVSLIDTLSLILLFDRSVAVTQSIQLDINIAAQDVEININTAGGANIVIDKLTQTAYTERQSNITNNGDTASWTQQTGVNRRGKFFPRGCRGFINTIDVYCRDNAAAGGTITVYISPHPDMGYVATADITVPASGAAAWRSATFNRMWNYDSMFIFAVSSVSDVEWGVDNGAPQDGYVSSDSGATWSWENWRHWFRAVMKGETIGDIPVSGTINTVHIPSVTSARINTTKNIPSTTETTIKEFFGAGEVERFYVVIPAQTASEATSITVYCDGVMVFAEAFSYLNSLGFTASTPSVSLLQYGVDAICVLQVVCKFSFHRSLKITLFNTTALTATYTDGIVNLIK